MSNILIKSNLMEDILEENLTTFGKRFKSLVKKEEWTYAYIADIVGLKRQSVHSWTTNPKLSDTVRKRLKIFDKVHPIDIEWLATGKRSPFKMDYTMMAEPGEFDIMTAHAKSDEDGATPLTMGDMKRLVGENREVRAFRITGQSMAPGLKDRDIVLCVHRDFREGYVHIVKTKDEKFICKRLKRGDRAYFVVQSDNPQWGTMRLNDDDVVDIWRCVAKLSFDLSNNNQQELYNKYLAIEERLRRLEHG